MNIICIYTSVPNILYEPFKVLPHYTVPKYWINEEEGTGRLAQLKKYYCKWCCVQCILYSRHVLSFLSWHDGVSERIIA